MDNPSPHLIKKRKYRSNQTRPPSHFFIGRPREPPYAWSYDDDEMRASNLMWVTNETIDEKALDRLYLNETTSISTSRVPRTEKREKGDGRSRRRKGAAGGIIDLTLSDDDDIDSGMAVDLRSESKSVSQQSPARSTNSPSTSSSLDSNSKTLMFHPSHHTPTKRRVEVSAHDNAKNSELRAVFSVKQDDKLVQYVTGKPS